MKPQPTSTAAGHPELLLQVARGDRDAFAVLYDETSPVVYGTALRVLRDPDLAAETTQDVMVELWRTAARFDPARGSVRAWVATLAHRRAVDRVRAEQAHRTRDEADAVRDYRPPVDDVAEEVERRDDADRVARCLDGLTDLQRRSILLAYWGGLTYREVAEDLGAALPTVKSRIRDGLERLRACLGVR
ncbi:RNA polymerase, sigma-24 subunit, ECF subfamily [Beutenbergia cavernae DSM 12333]|uniref:RNA polymerase, sigma-24 subunit, ECF subfamily n=1 Tax=Beutenbergia cavernae (strain ATCC BAA-8 / DSM 12333 / CCUG 43141 / JCM 11478 / NBRC 16432 / NCIMB 13614 / HKI 0122) TaxID=471853 RepID=C5C249_BEUC1|nr:ECF RNA polymerase sigma factor SigK [Beutenbergia cavernae]ACQ81674.1 RNA polymerase, sigma-24 subunit, ECF subfamily [Beutenbergia cavernae DSM 12333]